MSTNDSQNSRKAAFQQGLSALKQRRFGKLSRAAAPVGAIRPTLYNPAGMPNSNQILQGDSIQVLNDGPEGWLDLVFADPPFNIGYLYHGYDDKKDVDEYIDWSERWMSAVHRAL